MQSTSADYARVLTRIHEGAAINAQRQDIVYELFRRGLLTVDADNRLHISEAGEIACGRFESGESVPELDVAPRRSSKK